MEAFARRRERADIYKARQAQRAAELEAKKAEELNKYIPPAFETAKGGYWQPYIKQRTESEKSIALQRIKDAKTTAEKAKAAQDFNAITQELNYAGELETQKQKENLKALQETGYVADENALSQYYREQAATNPKFGETNHIVGFQEWLKKNPEQYVSPAVIGSKLLKQYQPREIEIQGKSQKEKFVFNPLFEPEKMKDELTGANIYRAEKVNPATAYEALQSNPALLKAAESYIEPIAARVQRDNPGMSNTEAYTMASGEFFTKALREGRAKEAYDYSDIVRGRKAAAPKKPEETTQIVETPIAATVYQKVVNPKKGDPPQRVVEVNFGVGENVTLPKNRKIQVGANRKVFVLGGDVNTAVEQKILKPSGLGDGSYVLNYGFDVQTYQKPKAVYRLTKRYEFTQRDGSKVVYEPGTILDINKVNLLNKVGAKDAYKTINKPIRISPRMMQWSDAVEQYKMPSLSNLDLIISEEEIPDLQQIEKGGQQQKSKGVLSNW